MEFPESGLVFRLYGYTESSSDSFVLSLHLGVL